MILVVLVGASSVPSVPFVDPFCCGEAVMEASSSAHPEAGGQVDSSSPESEFDNGWRWFLGDNGGEEKYLCRRYEKDAKGYRNRVQSGRPPIRAQSSHVLSSSALWT